MKVRFRCPEENSDEEMTIPLDQFVSALDADCHDPFDSGVFSCPICNKVHYKNEINCVCVPDQGPERILAGKEGKLVFHDGLVDFYILYAKGDSQ